MCRIIVSLCLLIWGPSVMFGQQDTEWEKLNQAIQVVREWLGDPDAVVSFHGSWNLPFDLCGPSNYYEFKVLKYFVKVDLETMKVTGWYIDSDFYIENAQVNLPLLSESSIRDIAREYARRHFPCYNDFPNWEIIFVHEWTVPKELSPDKEIKRYAVFLAPYYVNDAGQKIYILPVSCSVGVDPYTGEVTGFGYSYRPIPSLDLTPKFTAEEAKSIVEQAVQAMGAPNVNAIMSEPDNPLADGLVIAATETGEIHLAYAFDAVYTWGASGWGLERPIKWRAAVDAHTGELFYFKGWGLGGVETMGQNLLNLGKQPTGQQLKPYKWQSILFPFLLGGLAGVLIGFLMRVFLWWKKK